MSRQMEICEQVAKILQAALCDEVGVTVCVEDTCNPAAEIEKILGKYGVLVMVAVSGHRRISTAGKLIAGELALEIIVIENPKRNRLTRGRATVTSASDGIREALHWQEIDDLRLVYDNMQRADQSEDDYRMIISFVATQKKGAITWGLADGMQAYGEIVTKRTKRGGEAVFEPGRDGHAKFVGVRDPHLIVDLTANVITDTDEFPWLGDVFCCPINGIVEQFNCTASETNESTDGGKTIHLKGRTVAH